MAMDPKLMEYEDGEAKDAENKQETDREMIKQNVVNLIKNGGDPETLADQIIDTVMGHNMNDMETEGED